MLKVQNHNGIFGQGFKIWGQFDRQWHFKALSDILAFLGYRCNGVPVEWGIGAA